MVVSAVLAADYDLLPGHDAAAAHVADPVDVVDQIGQLPALFLLEVQDLGQGCSAGELLFLFADDALSSLCEVWVLDQHLFGVDALD